MWSGTQKGFASSGRLPIHKHPGSGTPAHIKGTFLALAMSAELLWSKHHVHQALCSPTAAQLWTCGFSNKLSGKPNSIQKPLLIKQLIWYSRSERGAGCHHGTALQQNLPAEILLATVVMLETDCYEKLLQMAPGEAQPQQSEVNSPAIPGSRSSLGHMDGLTLVRQLKPCLFHVCSYGWSNPVSRPVQLQAF